jgi:hypothetical protein
MGNTNSVESKINQIVLKVSKDFPQYINFSLYDLSHDIVKYYIIKNMIEQKINLYSIQSNNKKIKHLLQQLIEFDYIQKHNYSKMYNNNIENIIFYKQQYIPTFEQVINDDDSIILTTDKQTLLNIKSQIQTLKIKHQNEMFHLIHTLLHNNTKKENKKNQNTINNLYYFIFFIIILIIYFNFNKIFFFINK